MRTGRRSDETSVGSCCQQRAKNVSPDRLMRWRVKKHSATGTLTLQAQGRKLFFPPSTGHRDLDGGEIHPSIIRGGQSAALLLQTLSLICYRADYMKYLAAWIFFFPPLSPTAAAAYIIQSALQLRITSFISSRRLLWTPRWRSTYLMFSHAAESHGLD